MFSGIKTTLFIFDSDVRYSIHSFFVFSTIDLAFLDKNKKVIETKMLKPFRIYFPKKSYRYLVEGKNLKLKIGSTATFK
jgi:uncharacterized membrane protein (UPF0127 family)